VAVAGKVGPERAASFLAFVRTRVRPLTAREVVTGYGRCRAAVREWAKQEGHIDLVRGSLLALQKHLQSLHAFREVENDPAAWKNLTNFLEDLPGDLREEARRFFRERGYRFPRQRGRRNG
jgi:hypothetical protein